MKHELNIKIKNKWKIYFFNVDIVGYNKITCHARSAKTQEAN